MTENECPRSKCATTTTAKTAHLRDGELYMQLQPIN